MARLRATGRHQGPHRRPVLQEAYRQQMQMQMQMPHLIHLVGRRDLMACHQGQEDKLPILLDCAWGQRPIISQRRLHGPTDPTEKN